MKKMKSILFVTVLTCTIFACQSKKGNDTISFSKNQIIISDDITHFWEAYDAIYSTDDSLKQMGFLQAMFLDKASLGQQKMIEARRYTAEEYLESIKKRPLFWNSIRSNTENLEGFNNDLRMGVDKLAAIYPSLEMSKIYYTIGNFRSPGTGFDSLVLIGTEYALGDSTINTSELPEHVQNYYKINPVDRLEFLTVHEYIHTQQKAMVHNLLSLTLYEGIAEWMAIKATEQKSPWKAFDIGTNNQDRVRQRFEQDLFLPNTIYNWLWNSSDNEFQANDMSYYVGSKISSLYYENAVDKELAIKRLIEIDYSNETEVEDIVNGTNYFSGTLEEMYVDYESQRPTVISIDPIKNGKELTAGMKRITVHFSQPMNTERRGFDYGPLGEDYVLGVEKVVGFSIDAKSFTFEVNLKKNQHYQSTITTNFRSISGYPVQPYLIDFKTK
ncbi:MAG: hypothetical protein ACJATI_002867 [Halioglobus sp.]|jgi:hypothetical protein